MNHTESVYRDHHAGRRRTGFAVLEKERGELFKTWIGTGKSILDLGCRDGVITAYFIPGNNVTGADIDREALRLLAERTHIKTLHLNLQDELWPVEKESFDVVVIAEVLEHLYFPSRILANIARVLKPGGSIVGSVPNAFSLKNKMRYLRNIKKGTPLADPMHINHFSWKEIEDLLSRDFTRVELYPLGRPFLGLKNIVPSSFSYGIAFRAQK